MMESPRICIIVPTFNNAGTIREVISGIRKWSDDIIVVNDGCTDDTNSILSDLGVTVVNHSHNQGKGAALKSGFKKAVGCGFTHAVTIDADGQHFPDDLPSFFEKIHESPESIIVGNRNLHSENMPGKNTFANKFSNFWFTLQTGIRLEDTQSGFRAYPLARTAGKAFLTSRYEAELELLVFSAWQGTKILSNPIRVIYQTEDKRVSHFRPGYDFLRISLLNTVLCILAIVYGYPSIIIRKAIGR